MSNFKGKRVFISGGAGVIGQELVQLLVAQDAIVMVGDLEPIPAYYPSKLIYRRGDLNYITQQEINAFNPEYFFHLAATFERSEETYGHWEENFWHNIRLSNHLMTLMRNAPGIKRVINCSSYLIYNKELYNFKEPQLKPVKLKESDPINPRNLTGLAKLAHEIELDFLMKFKSDQFNSISARIYRGYGKNSRDVISRWIRDLINDKPITVFKQEGWFDYMYAQDTAKGLLKLALTDHTGIVNLGTGRSRQVKDIVNILGKYFPQMKVNFEDSDILFEASEADTTLLNQYLNWLPEKYLEETIPELIEFEKNRINSPQKKLGNVLVTSVSKKVPLVNSLKKSVAKISDRIKVFGGDIDPNCLAVNFVDSFWLMPKLNQLSKDDLVNYCKTHNIILIIPSRDGELEYFSKYKKALSAEGIDVMISSEDSINLCLDKLKFANYNQEIFAIQAVKNIEELKSDRFVVKEQFGAGSLSIGINLTKEEAIIHAQKLESPIYQPFVLGNEVSVDAYITKQNVIKGIVMRKRDVVVSGESQITTTFMDEILEKKFTTIIQKLNLQGHIILQAIIDKEQNVHVIECNSRFGGASTLAIQAGLDSFYWRFLEALDEDILNYPFIRSSQQIKQIRHAFDSFL